jgi:hypothetical protein
MLSAVLIAGFAGPCLGAPEDWARLPDGRVIIKIKDVRVALPVSGPDTKSITFTDRHNVRNEMTLKEVIGNPIAARQLFESADLVLVSIPISVESPGLFLGKFARSDYERGDVSFAVGAGAAVSCKSWAEDLARLAADVSKDDTQLAHDGWVEFRIGSKPALLAYVRSPHESTNTFFPGVVCGYFKTCSFSKCLAADLTASYTFPRTIVNQQDWLSLDQKVRDLLKYIFIDL